ncbi:MAG TPA: BlaI/MecI/CopY family transcriptional regulator, partial [Acidimicrobiales bacterium]|nr:BlaI/MecI/CopY family transcriptional regulator [Acidimicrobiales bacterium]
MPSRAETPAVSLGPLEAEVIRLVWREGLRTVAKVTERVNTGRTQPLDYRTILTVMSRLTKKKLLRRRRRGNTYYFSVTCTEEEFAARQGAAAVAEVVGRFGEPALAG